MHVFLPRIVLYQCKKMLLISWIRSVFQLFLYVIFKIAFHYLNL
jgi:flagellar biosynthesis protein FliQ